MLSLFNVFKKKYKVSKEIISFEKEELSLRTFSKNTTELANNLCSLAKASFSKYPLESIRIMMESNELKPQHSKLKWLAFRLYDYGKLKESYYLLETLPTFVFVANSEQNKYKKIISEYQYIKYIQGFISNNGESLSKTDIEPKIVKNDKDINNDISKILVKNENCNVALVSDEDMYQSLKTVLNCVYVTPFNYNHILSEKIDAFIITPTVLGVEECWDNLNVSEDNEQRKLLINIIKEFNNKGVKTVFYSNEYIDKDKVYTCFIKECKYVLSANQTLLVGYRQVCESTIIKQSDYLGINPLKFNPKNIVTMKNDNVFYSGIWFANNSNKCQTLNKIFSGVALSNRNLSIVNNIQGFSIEEEYKYPQEYNDCIIPIEQSDKKREQSGWIINYSKSSNQYCIDQCVRDLACGYLVILDYASNIHETLPYVYIVRNSSDVVRLLCRNSLDDIYERRVFSARFIFRNFNIFDNVNKLLEKVDLPKKEQCQNFSILVIGHANNFSEECFKNQSYLNKSFIDESLVTEELISKFYFVTWFSDKNLYEEFYLEDMLNGFKFSNSDFITKSTCINKEGFVNSLEYCYVDKVTDKYKTLFNVKSYKNILLDEQLLNSGINLGFCIDHLNLIEEYQKDNHSIQKSQQEKQYKLSVIIPVFNNGDYLYAKAFASLKMQTKFSEIEIVIVDDGSTDNVSVQTIKYLQRHYTNVVGVFLQVGGSGSASRPRNEGLKVCTGQFVTFLDPDDECLNDSYSNILSLIDKEAPNIIVGNNVYSAESEKVSDNCSLLTEVYGDRQLLKDRCLDISDIDFKAIRIQSIVINRAYIRNKNVSFIEHAIGEDSLFSWQILHKSKQVIFTDICMHVYYSQRNNSESNLLNSESLEKLYLIQPHKIKWLVENDLIVSYMEKKFEKYVQLKLLKFLNGNLRNIEQEQQIQEQLQKILKLYEPYYLGRDERILRFM